MMLRDLSSDHEQATGSSSHVLLSPLFVPARAATSTPPLEEPASRAKRKRSQPGNPDPGAEVIALSPGTLVATNRFVCEVCNKGFQRDQNLQLHRRGHNLPWKLRQRATLPHNKPGGAPRRRVYVCPEPTCVHHDPARALGDLNGIKRHFSRKHGEKRWQCERCGKRYAVHSDWKAHVKNCGAREHRCHCGILFSRKDTLLTHRAFCDALAEESARLVAAANNSSSSTITITCINDNNNSSNNSYNNNNNSGHHNNNLLMTSNNSPLFFPFSSPPHAQNPNPVMFSSQGPHHQQLLPPFQPLTYLDDLPMTGSGSAVSTHIVSFGLTPEDSVTMHADGRRLTRDFLGIDDAGEVEELQTSVPSCAVAYQEHSVVPATTACYAVDLTRQYHGRLPRMNEPWSHNF